MSVRHNNDGIIYGEQNYMIPVHLNCGKFVVDRLSMFKEKIALIDGVTGEQISFGEMVQLIVNTADALIRSGVRRGEVIGICSENRMEFFVTAIAGWCSGATVTLLNANYSKNAFVSLQSEDPYHHLAVRALTSSEYLHYFQFQQNADEMVHVMKISKPKYIFLSTDTYRKCHEIMVATNLVENFYIFGNSVNNPEIIHFEELTKIHVDVENFRPPIDLNGLTKTALILYSSGTTGMPKGARLTHLNLLNCWSQPYNTSAKDLRCLTVVPWSSAIGVLCVLDELTHNRTVVYLPGYREQQYLTCIEKYKTGMLLVVPPLVVMLMKSTNVKNYDVSSVEVMYCGGAPLDAAGINEVKRRFPNLIHVLQIYGMTESSGAITEETAFHFKPGSVGKVVLGIMAKVVDVETRQPLGPNQKGEVCIKGPAVFGGYIDKDMAEYVDEDGFFKTGDVCYYDEDGYFFYVDRIKELIKYKAGQVPPSELEAILLRHSAVRDAAVIGKPDSVAGELPTAFVVKKPGVDVTANELIDLVAAEVSSWKQLRGGVYFVEEIPKTASGKILRRILRETVKKIPS